MGATGHGDQMQWYRLPTDELSHGARTMKRKSGAKEAKARASP
jgi:hypothetical protein